MLPPAVHKGYHFSISSPTLIFLLIAILIIVKGFFKHTKNRCFSVLNTLIANIKKPLKWEWWYIPVIPALGMLKAGESQVQGQPGLYSEFSASVGNNEL
jgi:uncharacterized membrane protein